MRKLNVKKLIVGGVLVASLASNLIQYARRVQEPELEMSISRQYGVYGEGSDTGSSQISGTAYCGDAFKYVTVRVEGGIFPDDPDRSWDAQHQGKLDERFSLENVVWGTSSDGPFPRKDAYLVNALHHRIGGDAGTAGHDVADTSYIFIEQKK